jgi:hypothetical protein
MEKNNISQLELFSQTKESNLAVSGVSNSFLSYICKYEKAVLVIVGFIIIGIVSFSLGVEKGKRISSAKLDSRLDLATVVKAPEPIQPRVQPESQPALKKGDALVKIDPRALENKDITRKYTIQVASYQTNTLAKKEAEALRKKGLTALVLPKGSYTLLCVGNFASKETAASMLTELKKKYLDCFIRRL